MATVYARENSPFIYGSYYLEGQRVRFRTDHKNKRDAQKQADEVEAAAKLELANRGGLRLMEAADLFFKNKSLRPRTIEGYEYALAAIYDSLGDFLLSGLKKEDITDYIRKRQAMPGLTQSRSDLAFLSSLYTTAKHFDTNITNNPVQAYDKTGLPMAKMRTTWFTEDQIQAMVAACTDDLHRCLIIVAVDTGMRKQELLQLHEREIELDRARVNLGNVSDARTKTGRGRTIPLTARSLAALRKQIETQRRSHKTNQWSGFVFENPTTGKPITTVKTFWTGMCVRAGLKGVRFHDFRHTFVSRALHLGADATSIMAISGHRSADAFNRYSHASEDSTQRVIGLMQQAQNGHISPK